VNNGATNTGSGGGGGYAVRMGTGGSGLVIVAYPITFAELTSIGVGLTYSVDTSSRSGYRLYTFTAGTGTVTV
jgi:hypothetical protein